MHGHLCDAMPQHGCSQTLTIPDATVEGILSHGSLPTHGLNSNGCREASSDIPPAESRGFAACGTLASYCPDHAQHLGAVIITWQQ